jgi:isopenicillin N synthase-like dioxygenase
MKPMKPKKPDQQRGTLASSGEFSRYDQVDKPDYHLAEAADRPEDYDEDFRFTTCDLGRFLHGDARDRDAFVEELGVAMRDIGFTILVGHGVDTRLFDDAAEWVEDLFTQTSLEEKLRFVAERHGAVKEGYFPIKETSDIHPDLVEGWVFGGRAFDLAGDGEGHSPFDARAFWPRPEFEPRFRKLIQAELPLFLPIMQSVLSGLGCDAHLFDERLHQPNFGQRLNYYPPLSGSDAESGAGRLLGHEDVDLFTILPAPATDGLQVLSRSGKWVRLDAPPGSIILNTGDYLQRLSNDILPSTTHRVGRPRDPAAAAHSRVSFPLAAYLRPDEILEVLPGLPNPKYEPIPVITFHTRTTAKFYVDDYAVEVPLD